MNKLLFQKYLGATSFTFFKYIEIALSGIAILLLAKKIGPDEMGESISSLLYITYSSYLALGMNSLIVKNFKKLETDSEKFSFLTFNIQYFLVASLLNVWLAFTFLDQEVFLLVAMIAMVNLFRSFFMAYYRVVDKAWTLNVNNIVLGAGLLLGVVVYVQSWNDYLEVWHLIVWVCLLIFIAHDPASFKNIVRRLLDLPKWSEVLGNLKEGAKLATVGGISTVLVTIDRLIINQSNIDLGLKGSYQFAENISMAVFMGVSSIIFYYTPTWIDNIRQDSSFVKSIEKWMNKGLLVLLPILIVVFFTAKIIAGIWYPEYLNLHYYITAILGLKLLVLLNSLGVLVFMGLDRETRYIRFMIMPVLLLLSCAGLVLQYGVDFHVVFIPMFITLILLVTCLLQRKLWYIKFE